jgi:hypothetical protein
LHRLASQCRHLLSLAGYREPAIAETVVACVEDQMMRLASIRAIVLLLSVAITSVPAAETLDQQNDVTGSATADSTSSGFEPAQTFTVGVAGTLSRIEAQLSRPSFTTNGSVTLTIYNTISGVPNASLGTADLSWDAIPTTGYAFQSFDVSALAIPVHVGDVLAASIRSDGFFLWRNSFNGNTYAGGETKFRVQGMPTGPWTSYTPPHDSGFKTYVLATASGLPGDFNNNGEVDAADYVTWRKYLGAPSEAALNGHGDNLNGVDQGDYTLWRAHFAAAAGSGTDAVAAVPEPGVLLLTIAAMGIISTCGSRHSAGRIRR